MAKSTKLKDANEAKLAGKKPKDKRDTAATEAAPEPTPEKAAPAVLTNERWKWLGERPGWLDKKPPKREYLLTAEAKAWQHVEGGVLGVGEVGVIAGAGAAGKTRAAIQLAISVATGTPWLGTFKVERPGRVLLALAEESEDDVRRMLYSAAYRLRSEYQKALGENIMPLGLKGEMVALARTDPASLDGNIELTEFGQELNERLNSGGEWSLVIIDPAVSFAPVDAEKDNACAQRWINLIASIAITTPGNPTVLQIHHTNKASRRQLEDFSAVDTRGLSALTDGPRWAAGLYPATRKASKKAKPEAVTDRVCFRVTKVNHGVYPETIYLKRGEAGVLYPMTEKEVVKERLGPWVEDEDDETPKKPVNGKFAANLTGKPAPGLLSPKGEVQ